MDQRIHLAEQWLECPQLARSRLLKRTRGRPRCDRKPAVARSALERFDAPWRIKPGRVGVALHFVA
jgi:hypothetical protein